MRLVAISDTHGEHHKLNLPNGDVLIHAGDFTCFGRKQKQYLSFLRWFLRQPHKHKVFIAGNHEIELDNRPEMVSEWINNEPLWDENVHYLQNSGVVIEGLNFYGAPQQPAYGGLAFNVFTKEELELVWGKIPTDTHVLITHGPPHGILDYTPFWLSSQGCTKLKERLKALTNLKLHVFGHIHEGYGISGHGPMFVNAAMCDGHKLHSKRKPHILNIG